MCLTKNQSLKFVNFFCVLDLSCGKGQEFLAFVQAQFFSHGTLKKYIVKSCHTWWICMKMHRCWVLEMPYMSQIYSFLTKLLTKGCPENNSWPLYLFLDHYRGITNLSTFSTLQTSTSHYSSITTKTRLKALESKALQQLFSLNWDPLSRAIAEQSLSNRWAIAEQ